MPRARIELTPLQLRQAEAAFRKGESNNLISCTLGLSQLVWERALRGSMGDEAFDAQMARNLEANRRLGRPKRGTIPPTERRPEVRAAIDKAKGRDLASMLKRRAEMQANSEQVAIEAEARAAAKKEANYQRALKRNSGAVVPVFCETTGDAFGSLYAAAKETGLEEWRIRRSVFEGVPVFGGDGRRFDFRRWRKGDPEVKVRKSSAAVPLRFEDGTVWPSVNALVKHWQGNGKHDYQIRARLKKLGYGPKSPPLRLREMLVFENRMDHLEREQLIQRIAEIECCLPSD